MNKSSVFWSAGFRISYFYTLVMTENHTKIGISIPKEMLEDIDSLRKISNRSKFISGLIREPLQSLKGGNSS